MGPQHHFVSCLCMGILLGLWCREGKHTPGMLRDSPKSQASTAEIHTHISNPTNHFWCWNQAERVSCQPSPAAWWPGEGPSITHAPPGLESPQPAVPRAQPTPAACQQPGSPGKTRFPLIKHANLHLPARATSAPDQREQQRTAIKAT